MYIFLDKQAAKTKVNEFGAVPFPADSWAGYPLPAPSD